SSGRARSTTASATRSSATPSGMSSRPNIRTATSAIARGSSRGKPRSRRPRSQTATFFQTSRASSPPRTTSAATPTASWPRRISTDAGMASPTREQLFDPATNIAVGAAEFAQKLARMNGKPILAIAAYNAGEDAVGKWIAQTPVDDVDLFVESIPYAETRLYVK